MSAMDAIEPSLALVSSGPVHEFFPAFTASFGMILVTEIGDRTFFVAAIMAMRYARLTVLAGAYGALVVMTLISCVFGIAAIQLIPKIYVNISVIGLMFFFGIQLLRSGWNMSSNEIGFEEMEEVESEIGKRDGDTRDPEAGGSHRDSVRSWLSIATQAFVLTFFGEWGDRSQLATIALSASNDVFGVFVGGCIGHLLCTSFAVIGGRLIANYVTERTVTLIGGVIFLLFGFWGLYMGIN
eukprot:TRINITY_DN7134_c0_g1_i1.p1 TRINITY_DN7134_c0_g1~~TRINITY_DN7134_c0_g1_i1.p1  ORF type:complete len:240 (+),score=27.34 TRINITY_DN7134_c0_g1_i1:55-774(+)